MFDSIAPSYDWMNRAMTLGIDKLWRRKAVNMLARKNPRRIVDLATGTGDFAVALASKIPSAEILGFDLSDEMVKIGRRKIEDVGLGDRITLATADCLNLPLENNFADAVTVAYGVRNFEHLDKGYEEMFRILVPGGWLCVVELSTPVNPMVKPFYKLYTGNIIPVVGRLVSKDNRAYSYLPESIEAVPRGEEMLELIKNAGFVDASFKRLTFGVCTIYMARHP